MDLLDLLMGSKTRCNTFDQPHDELFGKVKMSRKRTSAALVEDIANKQRMRSFVYLDPIALLKKMGQLPIETEVSAKAVKALLDHEQAVAAREYFANMEKRYNEALKTMQVFEKQAQESAEEAQAFIAHHLQNVSEENEMDAAMVDQHYRELDEARWAVIRDGLAAGDATLNHGVDHLEEAHRFLDAEQFIQTVNERRFRRQDHNTAEYVPEYALRVAPDQDSDLSVMSLIAVDNRGFLRAKIGRSPEEIKTAKKAEKARSCAKSADTSSQQIQTVHSEPIDQGAESSFKGREEAPGEYEARPADADLQEISNNSDDAKALQSSDCEVVEKNGSGFLNTHQSVPIGDIAMTRRMKKMYRKKKWLSAANEMPTSVT